MRFLKADYIFPISSGPVKDGILILDDAGKVIEVLNPETGPENSKQILNKEGEIEVFKGLLCPGFINAHCHLELSHMKGKLSERQKLPRFLRQVSTMRNSEEAEIISAMEAADAEMVANGIVAVGDISNNALSFSAKLNSRIIYHTFIELFDFHPDRAFDVFDKGKQLYDQLTGLGLPGSIVPHAPYTVSVKLLKLINDFAYTTGDVLCIHNQETQSENAMFRQKNGELFEFLQGATNLYTHWEPSGFASLASTMVHLPKCNKIQLVHNTYSTSEDVNWAQLYSMLMWWCFCPNANLFIEDKLPDIPMFVKHAAKITIGTDSYASNWSLSVLDELKTIHKYYPEISVQNLLTWATLNGAEYLGLHQSLGSFEKGKKPGVNHLIDLERDTFHLSEISKVIPLE